MNEKIQNFSIFKVKEHNGDEKQPTHSISTKIGDKYVYIGRCWTKDSANGKFLSCSLDKIYKDKPGYTIEIDLPEKPARNVAELKPEDKLQDNEMPDFSPKDYPEMNPDNSIF
jgi:uncharacterized protein YpuA (DUF1002 family)